MDKINYSALLESVKNGIDWTGLGLHPNAKTWAGTIAGPEAEKQSNILNGNKKRTSLILKLNL
jgi:hypothetical protein